MPVKTHPLASGRLLSRNVNLDRLAREVVESGAAPAVSCAAGFHLDGEWYWGNGAAGTMWPVSSVPTTPDTVFDLASLTKPVFAIAAATESTRGALDLFAPIGQYLPCLHGTWAASKSLEQCLSHRAGLVAHDELYRNTRGGRVTEVPELLRRAANARRDSDGEVAVARQSALYSDLGYLLAGMAVEAHVLQPLDAWLVRTMHIPGFEQLGSIRQWLARDEGFRWRCAPTELVPWRSGLIWGRVHDENAWTIAGHGLSGHAGLFGTAMGVAHFGAAVLDAVVGRDSAVPHGAAVLTTRSRPGSTLGAGFDRKSEEGSTAGVTTSQEAFGHLGFTGTSIWCDPDRSLVAVLLTNRICPSRTNIALRSQRASLHERLFAWADGQRIAQSA